MGAFFLSRGSLFLNDLSLCRVDKKQKQNLKLLSTVDPLSTHKYITGYVPVCP